MTKEQVKAVLDRVLTWPEDRQQDAVDMLLALEEQDNAPYELTDEQIAEIKRRLADPAELNIPIDEVFARYRQASK